MSVFSKIRLSRKAAKEHKGKGAEKDVAVKVPYKHVPTHAAVDALSGAPSSWKQEDRSKIKEHHKRRTMMGNMTRTASALSTVSYMNAAAGPSSYTTGLPRTSSYSSYNPTWFDRGGDLYYSSGEPSQPRYKPSRGHTYHDSGIGPSPLASHVHSEGKTINRYIDARFPFSDVRDSSGDADFPEEVSPVVSSGNSTTSNSSDNLEMRAAPNPQRPQPTVYKERDIFDRLHTSTTRKLGEAPLHDTPQYHQVAVKRPAKAPSEIVIEVKPKRQRWSLAWEEACDDDHRVICATRKESCKRDSKQGGTAPQRTWPPLLPDLSKNRSRQTLPESRSAMTIYSFSRV